MKKVLVIAGPTASGKSGFAVEAAKRFGGEVISGDSIQVYRGFDIGSGKITEAETEGVKHHLIDILNPDEQYTSAEFQRMARACVEQIDRPVIAGGTGLYLKACLYDYTFGEESEVAPADPYFEQFTNEELYEMLKKSDPCQAEKIHPNNRRRLMRSLTIQKRSGFPQSEIERKQTHQPVYDLLICGCTMEREVLHKRIAGRVREMFENGLEEEVRSLLEQGVDFSCPPMRGIGYREWQDYFSGKATLEETEERIIIHSRQYARKQYTWLNHQMPVKWFNPMDSSEREEMLKKIEQWYNETGF